MFYSQGLNGVGYVYMVLEYGDIDLAKLLSSHEEARRRASSAQCAAETGDDGPCDLSGSNADGSTYQEIDANFIRLYWQQMLRAVKCIHDARIVHADLKPANFMLVQGQLKLIDFGIAKAIQGDTTSINRESQVGRVNSLRAPCSTHVSSTAMLCLRGAWCHAKQLEIYGTSKCPCATRCHGSNTFARNRQNV